MALSPLQIAVQGLGYQAAVVALQGLIQFVIEEVQKYEAGGGVKVRRRVSPAPLWLPDLPIEEDEALLLIGVL